MSTLKTAQEPMYLREVEENPKPSIYRDLIENAKSSGGDYWQIWHLLAFDPEAAHHLAALSHTLMHKPSPLSSGLRELIAAYTSSLNNCEFCMKAHAAVASQLLGDEALVWSVIDNLETSTLGHKREGAPPLREESHFGASLNHCSRHPGPQPGRLGRCLHLLRNLRLCPFQLLQPLDLRQRCPSCKR